MSRQENFEFSDNDFNYIRELVSDCAGINLADGKRQLVYSRLTRRLRELGLSDFKSYCSILKKGDDSELVNFINAITTNLTSFFREQHHFDFLIKTVFPELLEKNKATRRIRLWSAGCSTGEEPYSIAMTFQDHFPEIKNWDIKILATDLDTNVLETAKKGIYAFERVSGLPKKTVNKWFVHSKSKETNLVKVRPELQKMISFKHLNLMGKWPISGEFDFIFCRNVIIYFNKDTQRILIDRYANHMANGAYLFLGHSESLFKVTDRFDLLGHTMYQIKG